MGAFINYKSNIFPNLSNSPTTIVSVTDHPLWILSCKITNRGAAPIRFNMKKSRRTGTMLENSCDFASTDVYLVDYENGINGIGATLTNAAFPFFPLGVDGASPPLNSRILMKNQEIGPLFGYQNGIYIVTNPGAVGVPWVLTRSEDYDRPQEIQQGDVVFIKNGDINAGTYWKLTTTVNVIGTDPLTFIPETSTAIYHINELEIKPYDTIDIIDLIGVITLNFDSNPFIQDILICFSNGYTQVFDCDVGYAELKELP